jgi:hypothetical protein
MKQRSEHERQAILTEWRKGAKGKTISERYGVSINYASNLARQRGLKNYKKIERQLREQRLWQRAMANHAP